MLDHPRFEPLGLERQRLALEVLGAHAHVERPLDLDAHAGQRQAALLQRVDLVALELDHRVHEHAERPLGLDAVDEQAVHDAELGGGQADAERLVHQPLHPAHLVLERRVEHLDLAGAAAQHRVAVPAHVAQRGVAARAGLGIELPPLLGLLFLGGDLFLGHRAVESRD